MNAYSGRRSTIEKDELTQSEQDEQTVDLLQDCLIALNGILLGHVPSEKESEELLSRVENVLSFPAFEAAAERLENKAFGH